TPGHAVDHLQYWRRRFFDGRKKGAHCADPRPFSQAVYRMREAAVRIWLFAAGGAGAGDERAYFGWILAAGHGFDAGSYIDSPWPEDGYGLGNIGRGEAARCNIAERAVLAVLKQSGARRLPVEGYACAAH